MDNRIIFDSGSPISNSKPTAYRHVKVRLRPTLEQEELFRKSAGVSRWAYNFYLAENERLYLEYIKNGKVGKKSISEGALRKYINRELKPTTHSWLKEVGSNVMKQGVKDAAVVVQRWFDGKIGKPSYRSKKKGNMTFYVNYETLRKTQEGFSGERLGNVKTSQPLPKLPKGERYSNPRIAFDGSYWYLTTGYVVSFKKINLSEESLGIDVGIENLAILSNGELYRNINKSTNIKRLERKLKREKRKLSRKRYSNTVGYSDKGKPIYRKPLSKCSNYTKQRKVVRDLYKRIRDVRQNYLHQTTSEIVKSKPSRIVVETLGIRRMMSNRYLAKSISDQKLYEFKRQLKYKSEEYGIEFVEADRWFPSSKKCSGCGWIKKDLKLSDRTYKCSECRLSINRDYNASLNLANYSI